MKGRKNILHHTCMYLWETRLHFGQWLGLSPQLPIVASSCSITGSPYPPFPGSLDGGGEGQEAKPVTLERYFLLTGAKVSIVCTVSVSGSLVSIFPSIFTQPWA